MTSEALAAAQKAGPGLEALKLAVHHPDLVDDRLQPVLFANEVQRAGFVALVEADDLQGAIAAAPPAVADLLRRVTVEEPRLGDPDLGDPVDAVVRGLVREAVRRALAEVQQATRGNDVDWKVGAAVAVDTAQPLHWLAELDDPASGRDAAARLVAWLMDRERDG